MWTESAQVNFLPRFFSREVFYRHVVPGQKRENITTRGSQEKKSQVKEALLFKELSPKLKRDSSLDLTPMYGALIWSRGVRSSRHWSLS